MQILSFDISGKFAHFRKFYTTTSPLTFQIPPWTVVKGLIAGILGLQKDAYNEEFNTMLIGVKINSNVVNKKMFGMNYLDTRNTTFSDYIQVKRETIVNPSYTIYIGNEGFSRFEELKNNLKSNSRIYTPYLGVAEFSAKIDNVTIGEGNYEKKQNISIDSIIPISHINSGKNIEIQEKQNFEFEKLPYKMDNNRNLLSLQEFVFDPTGGKLKLKEAEIICFNGNNIILC